MKWRLAGSALLLIAALSHAGAQQRDTFQVDPLSQLDIRTRARVQGLIDSAKAANLPWELLRSKAIEGITKKVKKDVLLAGIRNYYKALELSKGALGPLATTQDIETGASLLAAHVSLDDLAKFRVTTMGRSPMRPLTYLADLIDKQMPRDEAIDAFSKLWKDGAADADFDGLWGAINQDILSGLNPRSALQSRMRSMAPRKPPGEMESEIPHS